MRKLWWVALGVACGLAVSGSAQAELVNFDLTAEFTTVDAPLSFFTGIPLPDSDVAINDGIVSGLYNIGGVQYDVNFTFDTANGSVLSGTFSGFGPVVDLSGMASGAFFDPSGPGFDITGPLLRRRSIRRCGLDALGGRSPPPPAVPN